MKNIDIEQLARKNIYRTPDNFFAEMQSSVLEKTVRNAATAAEPVQKQGRIIPMKWWYAAAAAVVLMFGAVFFVNSDDATPQPTLAQTTPVPALHDEGTAVQESEEQPITEIAEPEVNTFVASNDYSGKSEVVKPVQKAAVQKAVKAKAISPQEEIDMILEALPEQELVALTAKDQSDIYLDLYY